MSTPTLLIIATALALFAEGKYIVSVIRGRSKPNFSGWFIFSLSMMLVALSAYALGARESLILVVVFALLHLCVALLSFKFGFVRFTNADWLFLMLVGIGIGLWFITSNPWYTLLINIFIDACGFMTIASKVYSHPGTEDIAAWLLSIGAYSLNLMAITTWVPEEYLFSLSNVFFCSLILMLSLRKRA